MFFPDISENKRDYNENNLNKYTLPLDLLLPFLSWIQWLNYKMTKEVVCCNCCNIGGTSLFIKIKSIIASLFFTFNFYF